MRFQPLVQSCRICPPGAFLKPANETHSSGVQYADRGTGGTEAVVDVGDRNAAGTTVEHGQEGCDAVVAGAVTDAGWHSDNRCPDKAADDTGQCPFHAGNGNDHLAIGEFVEPRQQPMETGDPDIRNATRPAAEATARFPRFVGESTSVG